MRYLLLIILPLLSLAANAQSYTGYTSGNFDVYDIQAINITNLSGATTFSKPGDYFSGITIDNYCKITVRSNNNWQVGISTQSAYFTPLTSGGSTNMPANIVSVRRNGYSNFTALSTNPWTLKTGSRGGSDKAGNEFNIDMHMAPGFGYNGGVYSIGVVYTLTRQ